MSKVSSSTRRQSSSSLKGLSGKGASKVGSRGKSGKAGKMKKGLGKVSGGKSKKLKGTKSTGKNRMSSRHKSEKAGAMNNLNPFKQLGNLLGGLFGGPSGAVGSGGGSSKASKSRAKNTSGKMHKPVKSGSNTAGKSNKSGVKSSGKTSGSSKSAVNKNQGKDVQKTSLKPSGPSKDISKTTDTGQVDKPEKTAPAVSQGDKLMGEAKGTGYYPSSSKMEGGYKDMKGNKLQTLQDYMDGKAKYVSIALDKNLYKSGQVKYGDSFRIPEFEKKYGRQIDFRAVDTGGAFTNKGFSRVDICNRTRKDTMDPTVNGKLSLIKRENPSSPLGQKISKPEDAKGSEGKNPAAGETQQTGGDKVKLPNGRAEIEKMFGPAGKNQTTVKMPAGPGGKMVNVTCNQKIASRLNDVFQEIKSQGLSNEIKGFDGCYNYRSKRGGKNLSTHSWGIAVDINAGSHPMGSSRQTKGQKAIAEVFKKHGFYQLPNDPMHFQFCRGY